MDGASAPAPFVVEHDLVYAPPGWPRALTGDLYRPEGNDARPAVLLIYGGGWKATDNRSQMEPIAERLAQRGYVVLNATYRGLPADRYPAPVDDLREAVKWLRANASRYRVRPDRIATFGYSAGGHLAALIGVLDGPSVVRVQAVVAGGAPSDLTLYPGGDLVPDFLGGTRSEIPKTFRLASPIHHVDELDPPVFLYHGTADQLVPAEHATSFKAALDRSKVPNELFWLDGRGHITAFVFSDSAVAAAIDFLDRNLLESSGSPD